MLAILDSAWFFTATAWLQAAVVLGFPAGWAYVRFRRARNIIRSLELRMRLGEPGHDGWRPLARYPVR
jgi:hypothetical protein